MRGDSQIRLSLSGARIDDGPARNLPEVVDVFRCFEMEGIAPFELVEVLHDAVAPDNSAATICATRQTYHLAPVVNPPSLAEVVSWKLVEILDTVALGPEESAENLVIGAGATYTGKSYHVALFIDRRGRDPMGGANVAEVERLAFVPKHGVAGSMSSDRLVADAGDADDLTSVIDRRGGAGGIAGEQRQLFDFDII